MGSLWGATMSPCYHSMALLHATKVSNFRAPARLVNTVMHDSSSTWRTAKAVRRVYALALHHVVKDPLSQSDNGRCSFGLARMFASNWGHATPFAISLRKLR